MPKSPDPSPSPSPNPNFQEIDRVRDPDGIAVVITERVSDGRVSFMFVREYEAEGKTKQSGYMSPRHLPAVIRLVEELMARELLDLHEDRARARRRA